MTDTPDGEKHEYFTLKGWVEKTVNEDVKLDEVSKWSEVEVEKLFLSLLDEVIHGRLKIDIKGRIFNHG